jgi:hypothetical protein
MDRGCPSWTVVARTQRGPSYKRRGPEPAPGATRSGIALGPSPAGPSRPRPPPSKGPVHRSCPRSGTGKRLAGHIRRSNHAIAKDLVVVSELQPVELPAGSMVDLGFRCPPVTVVGRVARLTCGPTRPQRFSVPSGRRRLRRSGPWRPGPIGRPGTARPMLPCGSSNEAVRSLVDRALAGVKLLRSIGLFGQGGRNMTDEDRQIGLAGKVLVDKIDAQLLEVQKQGQVVGFVVALTMEGRFHRRKNARPRPTSSTAKTSHGSSVD